jgi:hypothetical protein
MCATTLCVFSPHVSIQLVCSEMNLATALSLSLSLTVTCTFKWVWLLVSIQMLFGLLEFQRFELF